MQNTENKEIWTALYARLSMDDGNVGESMSIGSQKAILKRKGRKWVSTAINFTWMTDTPVRILTGHLFNK